MSAGPVAFAGGRALAIVNPAAGRGSGRRWTSRAAAAFARSGWAVDVEETRGRGDASAIARRAVEEGYRLVVAVGGDGTANEVAQGLRGSTTVLALYPVGAGNDFARALRYPRRRTELDAFLASARSRIVDLGEVNGCVFLNAAGVGIDGHVAERIEASARVVGPTLGYFVGALASILTYRPQPMRLHFDDSRVVEGRHLVAVAANGTHFGNGMNVAPGARLDDGLLDVVLGGDLGRPAAALALARLYRGTHVNGSTIVATRARALEISLERPLPFERDGEVDRASHLSIRVLPAALHVLGT